MADQAKTADLILALGGDQLLMGQHEKAIARFQEAIRLDPRCAEAYAWLGKAYREMGRLAEAERAFREAIGIRPDFALAHYNLGLVHVQQGHTDQALQQYDRLRTIHPVRAERLLDEIQDSSARRRPSPPEDTVPDEPAEQPAVEPTTAEGIGAGATPAQPVDPRRVETVADFDHPTPAEPLSPPQTPPDAWTFPGVQDLPPQAPREPVPPRVEEEPPAGEEAADSAAEEETEDDERAMAAAEEELLGEPPPDEPPPPSIEQWTPSADRDPRDAEAYWQQGRAYLEAGDHEQAAREIEKAIAHRRDFAGSHPESIRDSVAMCLALGTCYERLGRFQDAELIYQQALDIDPDNVDALFHLGMVMVVLNNRREAIDCYRALSRLDLARAEPLIKRLLRIVSK